MISAHIDPAIFDARVDAARLANLAVIRAANHADAQPTARSGGVPGAGEQGRRRAAWHPLPCPALACPKQRGNPALRWERPGSPYGGAGVIEIDLVAQRGDGAAAPSFDYRYDSNDALRSIAEVLIARAVRRLAARQRRE